LNISVIIPTYNRANELDKCLDHLHKQQFPFTDFEVIIADDGSTDNTSKVVEKWQKKLKHLTYFKQKNHGAGVARNKAIAKAKGKISILIGDDIYCTPNFLHEHYKVHKAHPQENIACLGLILWYPEAKITPLMHWSTNGSTIFGKFGGHQFAYNQLEQQTPDYKFFYTSNLSLKTSLLKEHPFDPWFSGYGWEDIELGYRLTQKANLKIIYNNQALAYHDHYISESDFKKRMTGIGYNAQKFKQKYPQLNIVPTGKKKLIFEILSNNIVLQGLYYTQKAIPKLRPIYFYALSKKYFLEGLKIG